MNTTLHFTLNSSKQLFETSTIESLKGIPVECLDSVSGTLKYDAQCIISQICPQINQHIITMGIYIVAFYILFSWFKWWFFKHGYKLLQDREYKFWGNFHKLSTRLYWDTYVRELYVKFMLAYIMMVVYLNIRLF